MQYLILCHPGDLTAARVYALMRKRTGRHSVRLVTADELMFAASIEHCVGDTRNGNATASTVLHLHDGTVLDSRLVHGVLNRLMYAPSPCFKDHASANSQYAAMEMHALLMSMLESFCGSAQLGAKTRVIGRVSGTGLRGREALLPVWLGMAVRAGVRVRGYDFVSSPRVGSRMGWIPREPEVSCRNSLQCERTEGSFQDGYVDLPIDQARMMGRPITYFEQCQMYEDGLSPSNSEGSRPVSGCTAIAICGHVLGGELNQQERAACARLVASMRCDLVELHWCLMRNQRGDSHKALCGVNLLPDLAHPKYLEFLIDQMMGGAENRGNTPIEPDLARDTDISGSSPAPKYASPSHQSRRQLRSDAATSEVP